MKAEYRVIIGIVMGGIVLFFLANKLWDDKKEDVPPQKEVQINQQLNQLEQERTSLKKQIAEVSCPGFFDAPLGFKSCVKERELKANLKDALAQVDKEEEQLKQPHVQKAQPYDLVGDPKVCDGTAAYNNQCGK